MAMLTAGTVCQLAGITFGIKGTIAGAALVVFANRKKLRLWIDGNYNSYAHKTKIIDDIYKIANKKISNVELEKYLSYDIEELKNMKNLFVSYGKENPESEKFLKLFQDHHSELYKIYMNKLD